MRETFEVISGKVLFPPHGLTNYIQLFLSINQPLYLPLSADRMCSVVRQMNYLH